MVGTREQGGVVVPKVWCSEVGTLLAFFAASGMSVYFSNLFPRSVISGEIISLWGVRVILSLPLFWLLPASALWLAIWRVYDVRYVLDSRGIEARLGILSARQRVTRVRYEDVRSVETDQSFMERLLDVGRVEISTAASTDVEVEFVGVGSPFQIQEFIERERDRRQRIARRVSVARERDSQPTSRNNPEGRRNPVGQRGSGEESSSRVEGAQEGSGGEKAGGRSGEVRGEVA